MPTTNWRYWMKRSSQLYERCKKEEARVECEFNEMLSSIHIFNWAASYCCCCRCCCKSTKFIVLTFSNICLFPYVQPTQTCPHTYMHNHTLMLSVYAVETEEMQLLDAVNLNSLLLLGTSHGWGWFFFSELFLLSFPFCCRIIVTITFIQKMILFFCELYRVICLTGTNWPFKWHAF